MNADLFTSTGEKKGTVTLPAPLFEAPINKGLVHQAVVLQQSNRRGPIASTKSRGEIRGSTRKLYAQKGTGRARRGAIRGNILKGGNKSFGPKSNANFTKGMPQAMRHQALVSCLSLQAKQGAILGLESYPNTIKTKEVVRLLEKLPVTPGRRILFVVAESHPGLMLSTRNIPGVKTILAQYLNPEDVLASRHIVFLVDALAKAEAIFASRKKRVKEGVAVPAEKAKAPRKSAKKAPAVPKKKSSPKSA
ncbi:MAG: 50S ribosomal protein L4 [Candidatus Peribacteraceae bacterium]|nr:50S ribosomal protein L4 [Candidatus Peribacteraceae bacterium]